MARKHGRTTQKPVLLAESSGARINRYAQWGMILLMLGAVIALAVLNKPRARNSNGFLAASSRGDIKTMTRLLDRGVDVNMRYSLGGGYGDHHTALMTAASNRHLDAIQLLLSRGASVDKRDVYGKTALFYAIWIPRAPAGQRARVLAARDWKISEAIALELISHGANVNAKDYEGNSVYSEALSTDDAALRAILVNAGAK